MNNFNKDNLPLNWEMITIITIDIILWLVLLYFVFVY